MALLSCLALMAAFPAPDLEGLARNDLAAKLGLQPAEVRVVESKPVTWPDGSLGLPRPGEMATMALVPGALLTLEAKGRRFRYAAGGSAVKYGGPIELDRFSLLYLEPNERDANLNGNLMRCSVAGTNPQTVLSGVSSFEPGGKGRVLATRRTSRSGFELWLADGRSGQARRLHAASSYGPLALDDQGSRWAAVARARIGGGWDVVVGDASKGAAQTLDGPEGALIDRLAFHNGELTARSGRSWWLRTEAGWEKVGTEPSEYDERGWMMLNRSFSLSVSTAKGKDGAPETVVEKTHFSGGSTPVAKIAGLEFRRMEPLAGGWILVCGRRGEQDEAWLVQIDAGWTLPCLRGRLGSVRALDLPAPQPKPVADRP